MDSIQWGIIGCGDVTEVKSGPALQKVAGSRIVSVMRRNGDLAADYAARHGVPRWTDNAQELIDDPEVNAVYIATPPDSHAEYAMRVAEAGKPIYVEKPMARTAAECETMLRVANTQSVPMYVAYYRRRLPTFLEVQELVEAGAIGEVRAVTITLIQPPRSDDATDEIPWRVQPEIAGGGYFYDLASHQFDYLDYLFGPVTSAQGVAVNQAGLYSAEDLVTAQFSFDGDILGTGLWCFTSDSGRQRDEIEIIGSKGLIRLASFDLDAPVELERDGTVEEFRFPAPEHVQQPLIETVVAALLGKGECPSTGESALRTNQVLEQIVSGRPLIKPRAGD